MKPWRLVWSEAAVADLSRRSRVLRQHRGTEFARAWVAGFFAWARGCAGSGAQIGTEHPRHPGFRTFGYRRQATLLVEYGEGELRVVRIYFAGQDWTQ